MKDILKVLKIVNNGIISDKTINNYYKTINNLIEKMKIKNFNLLYFLNNVEKILKFIDDNYDSDTTKMMVVSSILNILRYFKDKEYLINDDTYEYILKKYRDYILKYKKKTDELKKDNKLNQRENKNWMDYNDIIKIYNKLYDDNIIYLDNIDKYNIKIIHDVQNMVILSLYILLEPRRNEYISVKYKNYDKNKDNYFDINNKLIVLNNYKTSKIKNEYIINLKDNKLYDLLIKLIKLKEFNNFKSDYLFSSDDDKIIDSSNWTKRLNSLFGINIGSNMLRKIYLTNKYGNNIDVFKNIKNTANNMGNSVNEIVRTYIKKK